VITLAIHPDQIAKLAIELARAGRREIGGVLVGEHQGEHRFRLVDLSVQRGGGTHGGFDRRPDPHRAFLDDFFRRTGGEFERFNYLGEWHSHPSFSVHPSTIDLAQMQAIVEEEDAARLFAILLVVRLGVERCVELSALAFRPGCNPSTVVVELDEQPVYGGIREKWWSRLWSMPRRKTSVSVLNVSVPGAGLMSMLSRFQDPADLIEALRMQKIVHGDRTIAEALAAHGELIAFAPGQNIIEQGASDRDVFFLLTGKGQLVVNGVRMYCREHGVTIGEMSAINPSISRSATVEAVEPTVAWKVGHAQLADVGKAHPELWRFIAVDLASRLEQRNRYVNRINTRPRVFLICSAEALPVAKAIRIGLEHDAEVVIWSDDKIFPPGAYPIEALEEQVNASDFGVALAEPDDLVTSRDRKSATPRDNVIFELGFFMSRLGRHRTILLVPRLQEIKLPSDFKGLIPIAYEKGASGHDSVALGPTIDKINGLIADLGVRASLTEVK
jgi:predicted nucleotide-binding protein/proteasome lid subunit RPN8/RPN11